MASDQLRSLGLLLLNSSVLHFSGFAGEFAGRLAGDGCNALTSSFIAVLIARWPSR